MPVATPDLHDLVEHVKRVKAAWRTAERQKTWEEKVEAIERMRGREQQLRQARDRMTLSTKALGTPNKSVG